MRITGNQIRSAMSLVGIQNIDVVKNTRLSSTTVSAILNDGGTDTTRDRMIKFIEASGAEFIPGGCRLKPTIFDTLSGREGLQQFFNDVHDYASLNGGTIMMFGIDETTFIKAITPEFSQNYLRRMTEISQKRRDLEVLSIICEGDMNFCASEYNEYRWISKEVFQAVPFYIYGETLAIMDFHTTPGPTIILLKSRAITGGYRKQFQAFWDMAQPISEESRE